MPPEIPVPLGKLSGDVEGAAARTERVKLSDVS
jgi:hypothetical protein